MYPTRKHKPDCSANRIRIAGGEIRHAVDESRCICGASWPIHYIAAMFVDALLHTLRERLSR